MVYYNNFYAYVYLRPKGITLQRTQQKHPSFENKVVYNVIQSCVYDAFSCVHFMPSCERSSVFGMTYVHGSAMQDLRTPDIEIKSITGSDIVYFWMLQFKKIIFCLFFL